MDWNERVRRRLKLRDLHMLQVVAEAGSMAKAAERLAVSHPAISKAIADLEQSLGVPLFDRTSRGVELTPYGRALLDRSVAIFDELRQGLAEIEFLKDPGSGEVRIGTTEPMTMIVAAVIDPLSHQYPRVTFHVTVGDTNALRRDLRERSLDVAITRMDDPTAETDLSAEALFHDPLVIVAGRHNAWTRRHRVELSDLMDEPWALSPPDSYLMRFIGEAFRAKGLKLPRVTVTTFSVQMRVNLVSSSRFLSILPSALLRFPAQHMTLAAVPVDLGETNRPVCLVTLGHRSLSPAAQLFMAHARSIAAVTGFV